ncbi:hypothetical protein PCANB_001753 [Pneumocystis canis]|nr:hypothetical protein PCANB_001753 [Pneumocystis canis]
MVESLESMFRLIGLSDLKIQETLKNVKLRDLLAQNIHQAGVLELGCSKTQGNLLYILSTSGKLLGKYGREYICRAIMLNKFQTTLQVETAIRYILDSGDMFNSDELDKACGVEDIQNEVEKYINRNKDVIFMGGTKKLGIVLAALRQLPSLKWADQLTLKTCVEKELLLQGLHKENDRNVLGKGVLKKKNDKKLIQKVSLSLNYLPNMFEEGFLARLHKPGENKQIHSWLMEEHLKHTKGRVVTRFPPEPNGYLHIGHSKAIVINFGFAKYHGGYCYLRYDDTNPESEEDIFVKSIEDTVKWLGFEPHAITFSSDYFDQLYDLAVLLIKKGKAYVCYCSDEEIKYGRGGEKHRPRIACKHRDHSISKNLKDFDDMKNGIYKVSEAVLRMKQDLEDGNPQMWDLVAYRILDSPHHRTGTKWRIYPTYDFSHCLVDSLENITHSLCTTEFSGSRPSYDWLCDVLEVYRPQQNEYGRLMITGTVLSKRKILKLVSKGIVRGWDDPRLYTLVALRRRGIPPGAILSFINDLGVTTAVINIQVNRFENSVRKFLENMTPRLMMILDPIRVVIENLPSDYYEELEIPYKADDLAFGIHYVPFTSTIYIDRSDFRIEDSPNYFRLAPGKSVGLLKVPFPIKATSYTIDMVTGLVSEIRAIYQNQENFEKPQMYIHWVAKTVDGSSPIYIDQVRIFKPLFKSENPSSHTTTEEFLEDINQDSECIIKGALIEIGFQELKQKQLKKHENIFHNLEFETIRFQAMRIGYFCMDKDSTLEKIVLNQIVSLKENKGK